MSLIQYRKPYSLLSELQRDLSQFLPNQYLQEDSNEMTTAADWIPSVDIIEEDERYIIHADVPGIKPKDIDVTMEKGVLTVKGHRQHESKQQDHKFTRFERVRGSFLRRFSIPEAANVEHIEAQTTNGVLTITIPKGEKLKPRRIDVK